MARKLKLFYSYADADEDLCKQLEAHLSPLRRPGLIEEWHPRNISVGTDWQQQINAHLEEADIILLLISPDFINSKYADSREVDRAIARHASGSSSLVPILLRPTFLQVTPFARLQSLPRNGKCITEWDNRDAAFQDVVQGIYSVIEERSRIHQEGNASTPERPWNVPRRNPFFTGREQLLVRLRQRLTSSKAAALSQTQAINGLGGVGKTQTAIEYAHRYRDEYRAAFWVSAASKESLQNDFTKLASLLNLPEKDERDQNITLAAVQRWFAREQGWLLILDNADEPAVLDDFLPFADNPNGHILITTRAQALGVLTSTAPISLEEMDRAEGTLLLLRRARLLAPDAPLAEATPQDRAEAEAIVDALDGLPLALDQAGAYIEETGCSLADYLTIYQSRRKDLLNWLSSLPSNRPRPVATVWDISFQKVAEANPASVDLLNLCAFLDPDALPEELFSEGASVLGPTLQPIASDPFQLNAALEALRRYSLLRRDRATRTLSIHRLVQAVLLDRMDEETQHQWAERTVGAVNKAFPYDSDDYRTWSLCKRLFPQAQACANLVDQYNLVIAPAKRLFHRTGMYLQRRALYELAEGFLQRALLIGEKVEGPEHINTSATLYRLARLYMDKGKYRQAEELYQRVLQILEKEVGSEHLNVGKSLHELGTLYQYQGKYEQAEEYYQRALRITEKELGPEHPETAAPLHQLGVLYQTQRKYEQAEEYYRRALQIKEKELGPEHLETAITLAQIGSFYHQQHKYGQVEEYYQQALPVLEKVLGYEHPTTIAVVRDYALLLQQMGRDAEAAEWLARIGEV